MARGRLRDRAKDETRDWRAGPIGADDFTRAQVLEHVYVPQEPIWPVWAGTFLSGPIPERTERFTQIFVPADDPWPTLPYGGTPRDPDRSTAQNAADALMRERRTRAWGVTLGLARTLIGALGIPPRCERHGCSRALACISDRARGEWRFYPGPAWPPCVANWTRAGIVRPPVERLIDRLDALVEARLTAFVGQPWAAAENIGLTHLPAEELRAVLEEMFRESAA